MDVKVKDVKDTGVFTQEGQVSGSRAASLTKQRQKQREEFEQKKAELESGKLQTQLKSVNDRFKKEIVGGETNSKAYGLKTREEFLRLQAEEKNHDAKALEALKAQEERMAERAKRKKKKKASQRKKSRMMLSFDADVDEEQQVEQNAENGNGTKVAVVTKNPDVRTDFLPDRNRDEEKAREIERLKKEWLENQIAMKKELIEITYSYWDGSGHRRTITVPKGTTIGEFLEAARQDLAKDFFELRKQNGSDLMYVKEDIIIPSDISFYDLIVTKARGKSGPLFHFDVHDDIRLINDARIEKDESHPGKICERSWYERNKHIFPASRWEVYDPDKTYSKYTIK